MASSQDVQCILTKGGIRALPSVVCVRYRSVESLPTSHERVANFVGRDEMRGKTI